MEALIWSFFGWNLLGKKSEVNLSAAERGAGPDCQDWEDPHQEGEDWGQEEAPPSPLPENVNTMHFLLSLNTRQYGEQLLK